MFYSNTRKILFSFLVLFLGGIIPLQAQVSFADISTTSGFAGTGPNLGISIGDYDNDGDDDVYVSRKGEANLLYQNNGNNTYQEVAESLGLAYTGNTLASVWGDFDNDGDLDLYLGNREEPNVFYQNNNDGTFSDITLDAGVGYLGKPRSVLTADVDQDGYLDIYVANLNEENALFKNNGPDPMTGQVSFTNIIMESGTSDPQASMGAMFFDYDNDGDSDLYLTHDANQPYKLFQNDGTGNFVDVSASSGTNYSGQGMGVDFGDINNDGWLDIYITNLSDNTLYLNNGDGTFSDISNAAMITDPGMGWGTTFLDYDNDGLQDIYMVNDSYFSPLPNILYRNKGDNTFEIVSENSPIASMYGSVGMACTDMNADGLVDIFVANGGNVDGNQLFKNETANAGNWFQLKTIGTISNRSAVGTKITIEVGGEIFTDEVSGGSGYASQNSFTLHFGLGDVEMIDQMTIRWTNGLVETYNNLDVNQYMIAVENESLSVSNSDIETVDFKIEIFPNPVSAELNVLIENEKTQHFEIYCSDLRGRNIDYIFSGEMAQGKQSLKWNPSVNTGMYLLTIRSEGYILTKKIFVE